MGRVSVLAQTTTVRLSDQPGCYQRDLFGMSKNGRMGLAGYCWMLSGSAVKWHEQPSAAPAFLNATTENTLAQIFVWLWNGIGQFKKLIQLKINSLPGYFLPGALPSLIYCVARESYMPG